MIGILYDRWYVYIWNLKFISTNSLYRKARPSIQFMIFEMLVKREQAVLSAYATFEICTRIRLLYPRLVIASLVYPGCMRQFTRTILHVSRIDLVIADAWSYTSWVRVHLSINPLFPLVFVVISSPLVIRSKTTWCEKNIVMSSLDLTSVYEKNSVESIYVKYIIHKLWLF